MGAAPRGAFSIFQGRRNLPSCEFVPDLCQTIADLAHLADLVGRKNNNLRGMSGGPETDSVPGHHIFQRLTGTRPRVLVPIPARR
jgi:hypothetical protein